MKNHHAIRFKKIYLIIGAICFAVLIVRLWFYIFGDRVYPKAVETSGLSDIKSPTVYLNTIGGDQAVKSIDTEHTNNRVIPPHLQKIIDDARANGAVWWAESIEAGWSDFEKGYHRLQKQFPPSEVPEYAESLLYLLVSNNFDGFGTGICFLRKELGADADAVVTTSISLWAGKDSEGLLKFAELHLDGRDRNRAFAAVAASLQKNGDFVGARSIVNKMPSSSERTRALQNVYADWARVDFRGAWDDSQTLKNADERLVAVQEVIRVAQGKLSIDEMIDRANNATTPEESGWWVGAVANKLVPHDIKKAAEWAEQLPNGLGTATQVKVAQELAKSDLGGATEYALGLKNPGAKQSSIDGIARTLSEKPQQAAKWVLGLPDDLLRRNLVAVVTSWSKINAEEATVWVQSIPNGGTRDHATLWLARSLLKTNSAAAREIANGIGNESLKQETLREFEKK